MGSHDTGLRWRSALTAMAVVLPFVLPVLVCCGGMGTTALVTALEQDGGRVSVEALSDPARAPSDRFVDVEAGLVLIGTEASVLPSEPETIPRSSSAIFAVQGARGVLAYCSSDCERLREPRVHHLRGRLCDEASGMIFGCRLPTHVRSFLDREAASLGVDPSEVRVLHLDEPEFGSWLGVVCTFGVTLLLLALIAFGFVGALRGGRRGPPRLVEERVWSLSISSSEVLERLETLDADGLRMLERSPTHAVLAQGRTERKGRLLGLSAAEHMPRTVTLRWSDGGPHRGTQVEVRVEEAVEWLDPLHPDLAKRMEEAIARTLAQLAEALGAQP
jgi:hypothetical protein